MRFLCLLTCCCLPVGMAQEILLVRPSADPGGKGEKQAGLDRFVHTVRDALAHSGVDTRIVDDSRLGPDDLEHCSLLVFPYNPGRLAAGVLELARTHVAGGGKLGVFYSSNLSLLNLVGIERVTYVGGDELPDLGGIRCEPNAIPGLPEFVPQASWNINASTPNAETAVIGEWESTDGAATGFAAVTLHSNGFTVSHTLMNEDLDRASELMMALAGHYVEGLWKRTYQARADVIGKVESCANLAELAVKVEASGSRQARAALDRARASANDADRLARAERYPDACLAAQGAASASREAFLNSSKPRRNELRGVWIHSAYGIGDWGWDRTIRVLAENGFNAIFPNMLWGAVADYPSDVLPVHPWVEERGYQIQLCLDACCKYGIEMHVWKVN